MSEGSEYFEKFAEPIRKTYPDATEEQIRAMWEHQFDCVIRSILNMPSEAHLMTLSSEYKYELAEKICSEIEAKKVELLAAIAEKNRDVLEFDFGKHMQANSVAQWIAYELFLVSKKRMKIQEAKRYLACVEVSLSECGESSQIAQTTSDNGIAIFREWRKGAKYRKPPLRAIALFDLWRNLGSPPSISRDVLWAKFCEKHPEFLDGVQNEIKLKSETFRRAKLDFLPKNKGGAPPK